MMLRCRDVATLISTDGLHAAPWSTRAGVRLHLMMCRHCRRFARQIALLEDAARRAGRAFDVEAGGLEERLRRKFEA